MTAHITLPLGKGTVTGNDPSLLDPGQLQESEGVVYAPSDPAARKYPGRVALNSVAIAAQPVNGLKFVDFDTATDRVLAQVNGSLYSADPAVGTFAAIRTGLTASATHLDASKSSADQFFMCNGLDTNWVVLSSNTTIRQSLTQQTVAPTSGLGAGGITGTFVYWTTEYDSTNGVESASTSTLTVTAANQTVTITKPATINASATHWRVYRSKDTGAYPIGWLVATVLIGTATYADSTTDAALVLLAAYDIVTINGISESQDMPAPVFKSLDFFEGSCVGVASHNLYWSETLLYHYFPTSYSMQFTPRFGGMARCVRRVGDVLLVFFDHDAFRVNYLPKAADSFFDSGVAQKHIGSYGTPSQNGACMFSGWGGHEMCLVAGSNGIMITDGTMFDSAVDNIDWAATVPLATLAACVLLDDPYSMRVRMFYQYDAADTTKWKELHFYYDAKRISTKTGFPELAWTGPHLSPGPGAYGIVSGTPQVWTGSRQATGLVYKEGIGYSDAALLADTAGTINFRLRTPRIYPQGIGGQARLERCFVHKASTGTGTYACTATVYNEGDTGTPQVLNRTVSAALQGASSNDFSASGQSYDFRVTFDGTSAMPPINSLTFQLDDVSEDWAKTNRA